MAVISVVNDSRQQIEPMSSVRETAAPIAAGVIESILARTGQPVRVAEHLGRLTRSVRELYGAELAVDVQDQVGRAAMTLAHHPRAAVRVHARPGAAGVDVAVSVAQLGPPIGSCRLTLADRPAIDWSHKWADRRQLSAAEQLVAPALPYFLDPAGQLAETSRGNLFVLGPDDIWRTPPQSRHILPGVTRQALLAAAIQLGVEVKEEPISRAELRAARSVFWTSSLSGCVVVTEVDGRPLQVPTEELLWARALGI